MQLFIATKNKNKLKEIKSILADLQIKITTPDDIPNFPEIIEDGKTLEENAKKKALIGSQKSKMVSLAEDTGLEVEYLKGKPGIYSARFAGPSCSYSDNNRKLLSLLKDVPLEKRKAKFRCIVAISKPNSDMSVHLVEGSIDGYIATEEHGKNGFGYDPVFVIPEYNKTFAELDPETKNKISHRSLGLKKAKEILKKLNKKILT